MSVFKIGKFYHFVFEGNRYKKSTGKTTKAAAEAVEAKEKERLKKPFEQILEDEAREQQRKTVAVVADEFLKDYKVKHPDDTWADYGLRPVKRLLGSKLVLEITDSVVQRYQTDRLTEEAAAKSINEEVGLLLRICGDHGDMIRTRLKRKQALKLKVAPSPGKPFSIEEQERMLAVALASTQAARLACERQARSERPIRGDVPHRSIPRWCWRSTAACAIRRSRTSPGTRSTGENRSSRSASRRLMREPDGRSHSTAPCSMLSWITLAGTRCALAIRDRSGLYFPAAGGRPRILRSRSRR